MPNYNQIFSNDKKSLVYKNEEFDKVLQRIDYSDFSNFIYFGSAYQIVYNTISNILNSYPISLTSITSSDSNQIEKYNEWINSNDRYSQYLVTQFPNKVVITNYDGTTGSYSTIIRNSENKMMVQTDIDYVDALLVDAEEYDDENDFRFTKFHPKFLFTLDTNETLENFLDIIGRNFDLAKISSEQLSNQFHINYTDYDKFAKGNEVNFAKLLGFNLIDGNFERTLSQYLLKDGFDSSLQDVTESVWNRIINNIPYIYKTKGSLKSIKSLLNCYGIADDLLRIKEYSYALKPISITADYNSLTATITAIGKFYDNDKVKLGEKSDFVKNYNEIGMSFEPIDEINKDIVDSLTTSGYSLDFASYFSDPNVFDGNPYYSDLEAIAKIYFQNKSFDLNLFVKFVDDFDKGLFDSIRQIIPARTKFSNEGVHIEPHLLQRRRITDGKLLSYDTDLHEDTIELLNFALTSDLNSSQLNLMSLPLQEPYDSFKVVDAYEINFTSEYQYLILPTIKTNVLLDINFDIYIDSSSTGTEQYIIDLSQLTPATECLHIYINATDLYITGLSYHGIESISSVLDYSSYFDTYANLHIYQLNTTNISVDINNITLTSMTITSTFKASDVSTIYLNQSVTSGYFGNICKIKNITGNWILSTPYKTDKKLIVSNDGEYVGGIDNISSDSLSGNIYQSNESLLPTINVLTYKFDRMVSEIDQISLTGSYTSLSSLADFSISNNLYNQDTNVLSTSAFNEIYIPNFTNILIDNEQKFEYKDNFIRENRYLKSLITDSTSANISINSTFANTNITGVTGGVTSSVCSVNMKILSQPMEFSKMKVIIPTSSSGNRLLNVFKGPNYTDTFQTLDCSNTSVSSNLKLNVFEFYTDKDGYIDLLFTNRGIRNGTVPLIFSDEFNYVIHTVDITLSGTTESGGYQSKWTL